jgi:hypothetical protein
MYLEALEQRQLMSVCYFQPNITDWSDAHAFKDGGGNYVTPGPSDEVVFDGYQIGNSVTVGSEVGVAKITISYQENFSFLTEETTASVSVGEVDISGNSQVSLTIGANVYFTATTLNINEGVTGADFTAAGGSLNVNVMEGEPNPGCSPPIDLYATSGEGYDNSTHSGSMWIDTLSLGGDLGLHADTASESLIYLDFVTTPSARLLPFCGADNHGFSLKCRIFEIVLSHPLVLAGVTKPILPQK